MGPTYATTNVVSSFGFSEFWRVACVSIANINPDSVVCDLMAGSGECWRYIPKDEAEIISIDFSDFMNERQVERSKKVNRSIDIRCENATATSLPDASVDHVISAFGLKTLSQSAISDLTRELHRILKPGGTFSLLEISLPKNPVIRLPYQWYLCSAIPLIGKLMLGDIECYRMLGKYTTEFENCTALIPLFEKAGLEVEYGNHFFGCATSLSGHKKGEP